MEVSLRHQGVTRTLELEPGTPVQALLEQLEIPPDSVLVTIATAPGTLEPIPLTHPLQEAEVLELVSIASGG